MSIVPTKLPSVPARRFMLAAMLAMLAGCATVPSGMPFQAVKLPPSGKGLVYIYDDPRSVYGGLPHSSEVLINNSAVGSLGNRNYLAFQCDPGPVTIGAGWGTEINWVNLNVEPGRRYYVSVKAKQALVFFGPSRWNIEAKLVGERQALDELKDCGLAVAGTGLASERWGGVTPGADLSQLKTVYVDIGEKGWESPQFLAEGLKVKGYQVATGAGKDMPPNTQCLVKVREHWFWDLGTYLLALEVDLVNPQTNLAYASAKVKRAIPQGRRGARVMATEVLNAIFNGGMPPGIQVARDPGEEAVAATPRQDQGPSLTYAGPPKDPAVVEIVDKAKARHTAFEAAVLDSRIVTDSRVKTTTSGYEVLSTHVSMQKGGKYRRETTVRLEGGAIGSAAKSTDIYDGKDLWSFSSIEVNLGGSETSKQTKKKSAGNEKGPLLARWWESMPEKTTVIGSELVDNADCFVLGVRNSENVEYGKRWIGKNNYLLVKSETETETGARRTLVNSDFRKVMGEHEMPYRTEIVGAGNSVLISNVVKVVELNTGLSDDIFDPEKVGGATR